MPQKQYDSKTIELWIRQVNEEGRNLSQWELSFMMSITDQFERTGRLSDRQIEILERMYADKTPT